MNYKPTEAQFFGERAIDLLEFRVEHVDFYWIADRLSKIPRFLGSTAQPYSVAQHCVWVCDNVSREARPWALLHDAHEAYIGDITRPVRRALDALLVRRGRVRGDDNEVSDCIADLEFNISARIHQAAGLPRAPAKNIAIAVRSADDYACEVEIASLVRGEQRIGAPHPVSQERARDEFLKALRHLCPNARGLP